jgi:hypothetical protein
VAPKLMFLFCLLEGALKILLVLRGGQREKYYNCRVSPQSGVGATPVQ